MDKDRVKEVVNIFKGRINNALQGKNPVDDITKAVWAMLKDLNIQNPQYPHYPHRNNAE